MNGEFPDCWKYRLFWISTTANLKNFQIEFFQILNAYSTDGIDFLDRAFNSPPDYLEDLTGLSEMRNTSDVDVIELSDDDF